MILAYVIQPELFQLGCLVYKILLRQPAAHGEGFEVVWAYHYVESIPITRGNIAVRQLDLAVIVDRHHGNVIGTPASSRTGQKKGVAKGVVFATELVNVLKGRTSLTVKTTSFMQLNRADSRRIFPITRVNSSHLVARRGVVLARFVGSLGFQTETEVLGRCLLEVLQRLEIVVKILEELVAPLQHLLQAPKNPWPGTVEKASTTFYLRRRIVDVDFGKGRVASLPSGLVWQESTGNKVVDAALNAISPGARTNDI